MDVRLVAAVTGEAGSLNVSRFCEERGISRQTFYAWRRRYAEAGLEGLEPRSSRPRRSPRRHSLEVEDEVVRLRKQLIDAGLDAGADAIQAHLYSRRLPRVPSTSTIWRILHRRGLVIPEPRKRPKSSWRRFEAAAPNELWQADVTKWVIAPGEVEILTFLDDHSRLVTACRAVRSATTEVTWEVFCQAVHAWGLPAGQLSDNGLNFSGRLRGFEVSFEANLRAAGVRPITSRAYHPQTCGKVERFQQTLKKWLRRQRLAPSFAALQDQLDWFIAYYNTQRPHRGIGRGLPIDRWTRTPKAINLGQALPTSARASDVTVDRQGLVRVNPWVIHIGVDHTGSAARVILDDTHAAVFIGGRLVRHLALDRTRPYQPSGRPRGTRPLR